MYRSIENLTIEIFLLLGSAKSKECQKCWLRARGQRFGEVFQMGQKVRVVITATNLERREIEMELV